MLKGFKDFILRGNVVELATAVIIGAAFTAIVTAFTTNIISPLFAAIPTGSDDCGQTAAVGDDATVQAPTQICGFGFNLVSDNSATFMDFGALLAAVINFLIVAAVVYFLIIVPYNKLSELGGFGKKSEVSEVSLLTEIRDLLDRDGGTSAAKQAAERELPDHLTDGPGNGPGGGAPAEAPGTQRLATPPTSYDPQGGYSTPPPAPGNYPAPGNQPPQPGGFTEPGFGQGQYGQGGYPPGQYRGESPDGPGRHSR